MTTKLFITKQPFFLFLFLFLTSCSEEKKIEPEGITAELYSPFVISSKQAELMLSMNLDETKAYFNRFDEDRVNLFLMYTTHDGKAWKEPINVALFDDDSRVVDPFLSYDERFLFFSSDKLKNPKEPKDVYNVWYVEIKDNQYSHPIYAEGLNSDNHDDIYTTMTRDNVVAFSSERRGDQRRDIYLSNFDGTSFSEPERQFIPGTGKQRLGNPGISPDGNTIVFSARLKDANGPSDLYVTEKTDEGWSMAKNLGPIVNSEYTEFTPVFSKDGKYLYYTSEKAGVVQNIENYSRPPGDFYRIEWKLLMDELGKDVD